MTWACAQHAMISRQRQRVVTLHVGHAGAVEDFSVTIAEVPSYGDAWMRRGQARAALGEDEDALADLTRCLSLTTADPHRQARPQPAHHLHAAAFRRSVGRVALASAAIITHWWMSKSHAGICA